MTRRPRRSDRQGPLYRLLANMPMQEHALCLRGKRLWLKVQFHIAKWYCEKSLTYLKAELTLHRYLRVPCTLTMLRLVLRAPLPTLHWP